MAINRPVSKTIISTVQWGIPITDEVNRLAGLVDGNVPTPWVNPTFQNGWSNVGGGWATAQYRKIGDNVQVRGYVQGGASNTVAFTLPVGFRPPLGLIVTSHSFNGTSRIVTTVQFLANGAVNMEYGGPVDLTAWFSTVA